MKSDLLRLIQTDQGDTDALFNDLAIRLYRYQFEQNPPYRQFCLTQSNHQIDRWQDIPPLPVTAFKYAAIACRPLSEAVRVFHSSGTSHSIHSCHFIFDLEITKATILSHFKKQLCLEKPMQLFILTPSPEEAPHSSLSYMMEVIREAYGTSASDYYIQHGRLQGEKLAYDLSEATTPVMLLGTSFSFVHLIDFHVEGAFPIVLPEGSRIMDTGGFKGKSRAVSRYWLYAMIEKRFGIPESYCVNEYGMSELTSQFYDSVLGKSASRVYHAPPQTRWQILSPETRKPARKGEAGLLAIYDLSNIDSVMAILTEDIVRESGNGFEWISRATGADLKGCSLEIDTLLQTS